MANDWERVLSASTHARDGTADACATQEVAFAWVRTVALPQAGFEAHPLNSAECLLAESEQMCNCVASYGRSLMTDRRFAFSLRSVDGCTRSTVLLGFAP